MTYGDSWEKSCFSYTKKDARDQQTMEIANETHERHDNAPCYHDRREPSAWPQFLQKKIAWYFECGIAKKEHRQADVVLG